MITPHPTWQWTDLINLAESSYRKRTMTSDATCDADIRELSHVSHETL